MNTSSFFMMDEG
jgi:hypothetical protein